MRPSRTWSKIRLPTMSDTSSKPTWPSLRTSDPRLVAADPTRFTTGHLFAERYLIASIVGRGTGSVVYRCLDRLQLRDVAVKVLSQPLDQDSNAWAHVAPELRDTHVLSHPNVCEIYDAGIAEDHVFVAMEFAEKGSLRACLGSRIEDGELRTRYAFEIISGLATIHSAGLLHRDLKPENILRTEADRLKISDFGIAVGWERDAGGDTQRSAYAAPELVVGQEPTMASDVWSLGVVLHEVAFGRRPDGSDVSGSSKVTPAGDLISEICRHCLRSSPYDRPRDAREVLALVSRRALGRGTRKQVGRLSAADSTERRFPSEDPRFRTRRFWNRLEGGRLILPWSLFAGAVGVGIGDLFKAPQLVSFGFAACTTFALLWRRMWKVRTSLEEG